jgi:hypothetical protein
MVGWCVTLWRPQTCATRRRTREEADIKWKNGDPSTLRASLERKGWFGSEEAELFLTSGTKEAIRFLADESKNTLALKESKSFIAIAKANDEANDAREQAVVSEESYREEPPASRVRKTTSLIVNPEYVRPLAIPSTAPVVSYRKELKELFESKIEQYFNSKAHGTAQAEDLAQLKKWQAQTPELARVLAMNRLSAREIAEQVGHTVDWVRGKRSTIAKIINLYGSRA